MAEPTTRGEGRIRQSAALADQVKVATQVRVWRDELIDLTRRNKLINLPTRGLLAITQPNAVAVLSGLGRGWRFHYPPVTAKEGEDDALMAALEGEDHDLDDVVRPDELLVEGFSATKLSATLRNLERKATAEWNDKGIGVLYLAVGALEWFDGPGESRRSPLLMVPVTLQRDNPREPFRLAAADDDPVMNPGLGVKLEHDYGIALPEADEDTTVSALLNLVRKAVKSQPAWKVVDGLVLGTFSFAKEAMYRDLEANEAQIVAHPLVQVLSGIPRDDLGFEPIPERELDRIAPPELVPTILDADGTQRECLQAARDGRSFVMEGPPGTGKSQTIANLIADLMRLGRTVLFVSEKAAALDVVKRRLDAAGLGSYVLELHSHKATRKEVAAELGRSLGERPRPRASLTEIEVVQLRERRERLSSYAEAINVCRQPLGMSLHDVLGRLGLLAAYDKAPIAPLVDETLTAADFAGLLDLAGSLSRAWGPIARGEDFLWRDLLDSGVSASRSGALAHTIHSAADAAQTMDALAAEMASHFELDPPSDDLGIQGLALIGRHLADRPEVTPRWLSGDHAEIASKLGETLTGPAVVRREALDQLQLVVRAPGEVPSAFGQALDTARVRLQLDGPIGGASLLDLPVLAHELSSAAGDIERACEQAAHLAGRLGLGGESLTPRSVEEMCRLADLAGLTHRPERAWFDLGELASLHSAISVLGPLVDQWQAMNAELAKLFNEQLDQLDVEAFYGAESDLVPQLSRFSGVGRAHRRQLQAATIEGKITDDVRAALPLVRSWKKVLAAIRARDDLGALLGPNYWRAERTDFEAVDEALRGAETALEILGSTAPEAVKARISRVGVDREATVAAGLELRARHDNRLASLRSPFLADVRDEVTGMSHQEAVEACGSYQEGLGEVADLAGGIGLVESGTTLAGLLEIGRLCGEVQAADLAFADADKRGRQVMGALWNGVDTDWAQVSRAVAWAVEARSLLGGTIDEAHAVRLFAILVDPVPLTEAVDTYARQCAMFLAEFRPQRLAEIWTELESSVTMRLDLLLRFGDTIGDIEEWQRHETQGIALESAGLSEVLKYCRANRLPAEDVRPTFERAILSGWAGRLLKQDRALSPSGSADRDALVKEFQDLDRRGVMLAAAKVIDACNLRRPTSTVGEAGVILAEANKKTRHRPIRQLLSDAGHAAQAVKPCFMMSPLSVSQFLPTSITFDTVIFDEASQIRPCDAINAIYRGEHLIVAGDEKQLPPTSFFQLSDDEGDQWDEDEPEVYESMLGLSRGVAAFPALPLRWHYRSQHEALITFSNRQFYESRLVTYPGALDTSPDVGVELITVPDGVYGRGSSKDNAIEARRVVDRIISHAEKHPRLTLGVVAFSEPQATRIAMELEAVRRTRPDLDRYFTGDRLDGFFIKNLESVQGDERDIILFSIGYGRDEYGKLTMNFGPLNREGGFRRLNVAVTRARRRVEVVSSITAADLIEPPNYGVQCLKAYLDYAARGVDALAPQPDGPSDGDTESPFEDDVLSVIRGWGYEAHPQVGHLGYRIDMGIRHPARPGEWVIGIECDGAAYHSSLVARDRDRLRQDVLEGLGWRLHRIWGTAWYRQRSKEMKRLHEAIEGAIAGGAPAPPVKARPPAGLVTMESVEFDAAPPWTIPYRPFTSGGRVRYSDLGSSASTSELRTEIRAIVEAEGPVTKDLLLIRLRELWTGQNLTTSRIRNIDQIIAEMVRSKVIVPPSPDVVALADQRLDVVRRADGVRREKVNHVPQTEIGAAMVHVARDAHRIDRDELTSRVALVFGWARRGSDIDAVFSRVLRRLLEAGELVEAADGMYTAPRQI